MPTTPARSPLSFAVLIALAALPLHAQDTPADAAARSGSNEIPNTLDTVVVTGTRVSDRTVAESIAPIDIITSEVLESTGTTELATALARALPSLNFPRPALVDGTDAVRPAQLRGLAPDQVLVLVNGKRRHTTALVNLNGSQGRGSSPVDLNAIPIAAIERVEVLRDGASAQYGSDAIAGVVNIVLKGSGTSGSIAAQYGMFSAGDGKQYQVQGDVGFDIGEAGFIRFAGQSGKADQTDRARPFLGPFTPTSFPAGQVVQRFGDPEIDQGAVSFNSEYSPAEGITFYGFGTASKREAVSTAFFRAAGNPTSNVPAIYPNGFLPEIHNDVDDQAVVLGLKGFTAGGFNIDLSYDYGHSEVDFNIENSLNAALGAASPTRFYAGSLEVTQQVLNLDVNKQLDWGLAYPVTLAFGTEWRGEEFEEFAGEPASYVGAPPPSTRPAGSQGFPGFRPGDAGSYDRHSYALYANVEGNLTEKFSAGLAARYEDYSDFGDATSGKVSARYAFTDRVALRATVSNGFRAPALQQQFFQATSTTFIGGVPYEVRTFAVTDPAAQALGSEPLKAEESTNYGLGLVLQPIDNLYITVDAYRIEIDDRILLSENLIGANVTALLVAQGITGVTGGRYFTNAVDTTTNGVDVVGSYRWNVGDGSVQLTSGYNYNRTNIDSIAPNPPQLTAIGLQRIGRTEQGRITRGAPRDKFLLGGSWTTGNWNVGATATHYGQFTVLNNTNVALDQTFDGTWTLDLSGTYTLDKWAFTIGADNVLNEYPDEVLLANSNGGQLPYSSASPYGFNGAYGYARVGYKW